MGFLVPKYNVSAPPEAPEAITQDTSTEINLADSLAEKRKKRKGMEATLLSNEHTQNTTAKTTLENKEQYTTESAMPHTSTGVEMNRKTLG